MHSGISAATDRVHDGAVEVRAAGRDEDEARDAPAGCGALEGVAVLAPELPVGRAVDVAVPGIEVRDALGPVGAAERDPQVGDVVAGCGEGALQPDRDRGGDRSAADDGRRLRAVVDGRVLREERSDLRRLVAVEVVAVRVDEVGDGLAVDELADRRAQLHVNRWAATLGVGRPLPNAGLVAVPAKQVGDGLLGEAQAVMHPEPVRSRALGVVEVDLVGNPGEERGEAAREAIAGVGDTFSLSGGERVARRLDHPSLSRNAWTSSVRACGSKPTMCRSPQKTCGTTSWPVSADNSARASPL